MKKFALLGQDIQYSLSPKIHKLIYEHMGVHAEYSLISTIPQDFGAAVRELFRLDGFNVTKPYKMRIVDYLTSVENEKFDSVNTVVIKHGGKRIGYNTDYDGFKKHFLKLINPRGHTALVLGAGGVADPVTAVLTEAGAKVSIFNRTYARAEELAGKYGAQAVHTPEGSYEIIVNCTSLGLSHGENAAERVDFSGTVLAYDTIYFDTAFLKTAAEAGVPFTANGLEMLVYQAIRADELFFDTKIHDAEALAQKILDELRLSVPAVS